MKNVASVQVACPSCEATSIVRIGKEGPEGASPWCCLQCHASPRQPGPPPVEGQTIDKCWVCGTEEFYIQKDFNRELGLTIVLLSGGIIFLVMLLTEDHRLGVGLLLVVALIDWMIYRLINNVTVCYLCQSLYRGFPQHENHGGFYLGLEEKYKKLRRTWLETCVCNKITNE